MKFTTIHINALAIALALVGVGLVGLVLGHECLATGVFGIAGGVAMSFAEKG